jgi:hypothetical protein
MVGATRRVALVVEENPVANPIQRPQTKPLRQTYTHNMRYNPVRVVATLWQLQLFQ